MCMSSTCKAPRAPVSPNVAKKNQKSNVKVGYPASTTNCDLCFLGWDQNSQDTCIKKFLKPIYNEFEHCLKEKKVIQIYFMKPVFFGWKGSREKHWPFIWAKGFIETMKKKNNNLKCKLFTNCLWLTLPPLKCKLVGKKKYLFCLCPETSS